MEQLTMSAPGKSRQTTVERLTRFCAGFRMPAIDNRATCTGGRRPKAAKERTRGDSAERLPRTPLWGLYERGHCQA